MLLGLGSCCNTAGASTLPPTPKLQLIALASLPSFPIAPGCRASCPPFPGDLQPGMSLGAPSPGEQGLGSPRRDGWPRGSCLRLGCFPQLCSELSGEGRRCCVCVQAAPWAVCGQARFLLAVQGAELGPCWGTPEPPPLLAAQHGNHRLSFICLTFRLKATTARKALAASGTFAARTSEKKWLKPQPHV